MVQEFLKLFEEYYTIPLYLFTWIIAVVRYRTYFDTVLKYFPIFIIYTFFTELLGYLIKHSNEFQFFSEEHYSWHNVIIYNIYSIVSFLFFYYIYWTILKSIQYKKWVKYAAVIALLGYVTSSFFQDPFHSNLYYADLVASIFLLIIIGLYFKEKSEEPKTYPMNQNLLFWISVGLFIFHLFFPFIFLAAYEAPGFYAEYSLHKLLMALIVLMYTLFIVGFVAGKRKAFR